MSETEAPPILSEQQDRPPYMSETEAPPILSEQQDRPPCMSDTEAPPIPSEAALPSDSMVKVILLECHYNWFEFQDRLADLLPNTSYFQQDALLQKIYTKVSQLDLSSDESELIRQSYLAVRAAKADQADDERLACALNGEIVTDSESDDPECYTHLKDPLSEAGKKIVVKQRAAIWSRAQRLKAKAIAEERFYRESTQSSRMVQECPGIGQTIETFVEESNVGADHWRRTGVLTFDGNTRLDKKVTYERIRKHLERVYHRHFAYGTIVELCVPRNR